MAGTWQEPLPAKDVAIRRYVWKFRGAADIVLDHWTLALKKLVLDDAVQLQEQTHGTFLVVTTLANRPWEVIVSPDEDHQLLVVVTAYPC